MFAGLNATERLSNKDILVNLSKGSNRICLFYLLGSIPYSQIQLDMLVADGLSLERGTRGSSVVRL